MDRTVERAAQWGIDSEYVDARGQPQKVDPEGLAKIVDAVAADQVAPQRRWLPATVFIRQNREPRIFLTGSPPAGLRWEILSDDGRVASGAVEEQNLRLPHDLPLGTYRLRLHGEEGREEAALLVTPERAYQGDAHGRMWALAVQLYGLRSQRNWGIGDFGDLSQLVDIAARVGAAGIGLNPLHVLFDDRPEQASPYAPNSRLFLNPLYIDLRGVPEFPGLRAAKLNDEVKRLRGTAQVDYTAVAAVKMRGLRIAYDTFRQKGSAGRHRDFENFRTERGEALQRFASFEVLRRRDQRVWWEWPEEWRSPDPAALARLRETDADEVGFYEFAQWIADRQLGACHDKARRLGMALGLYIDLAVGVDAGGADAWSEQGAVLARLSVGAPPDLLNTAGQNWGLAGFNPAELEAGGFAPFRRMLAAAMRHAGAVRLDHVLGLKRLFVIPHGMDAKTGAYLRFPFEAMLAVIAQESMRYKNIVIGEDLGTVPEGFRDTIGDWGLWSYMVMLFEREWNGSFHAPERYLPNALVTFSTHDLPTLTGWTRGHDMRVKRGIGVDPGESDDERERARHEMREALARRGLLHEGRLDLDAVARFLAAAPSRLLVISLEDILEIEDQPNIPGTTTEHPNWRQRLPVTVDAIGEDERLLRLGRILAEAGRGNPHPG